MSLFNNISVVTISCADIRPSQEAYCRHLYHEVVAAGEVSAELAKAWGLAGMAGAEYALLSPAADGQHFIRLIQTADTPDYKPFTTFGWNAIEIAVKNVDRLAAALKDSPFEIVGPPDDLSFSNMIRACQVVGPSKEVLYLTEIKGEVPGFELPQISREVGHCFVTILGSSNISATIAFYHDNMAVQKSPLIDARLSVLSAALGLPREHRHKISALTLSPGYLLEVDQFPETTAHRASLSGQLVPGISMVSFAVDDISHISQHLSASAIACDDRPYSGRRVATLYGPDNEQIELIEAGSRKP